MTDASWPDPQRPGVPLNPERDGWHWIDVAGDVIVARWWAEDSSWTWGVHRWTAQIASKAAWFYHGPAMTPADLAAHSAAAAREMREKAAAMCRVNKRAAELFADPGRDDERTAYTRACGDILRTIAALPLPGADALAADRVARGRAGADAGDGGGCMAAHRRPVLAGRRCRSHHRRPRSGAGG